MTSSVIPASGTWPSSLQPLSVISTPASTRDMDADIREFWSSFPCPPPWKPQLLVEVNASRLDPLVSRTVQSFLAGKCQIRHILPGFGDDYDLEPGDLIPGIDLRPTDTSNPGSPLGGPANSDLQWCDTTCQLSFGCAVLFVVSILMVALVICVTRSRVRHKMAAARPSRQQLQLSTSTSDAVNCTEFSNLEVGAADRRVDVDMSVARVNPQIHGDDDLIYPPFRHRGLPHPPPACRPSCDPKWNCANCSSCHPLMRTNTPDLYYSRAYSAVYETVDNSSEDVAQTQENDPSKQSSATTPTISDPRDLTLGCVPYQVSPTSISTVLLRPRLCESAIDKTLVAETGFNGDDGRDTNPKSTFPKYFELEQSCALSGRPEPGLHDQKFMNTFGVSRPTTFGECYNSAFSALGNGPVDPIPGQQGMVINSPSQSCAISLVQRNSIPRADQIHRCRFYDESADWQHKDEMSHEESQAAENKPKAYSKRHSDNSRFDRGSICYVGDHRGHNLQLTPPGSGPCSVSPLPYNSHVCSSVSTFLRDIPNNFFCPSCQPGNSAFCVNPQRLIPAPSQLLTSPTFPGTTVGPDLLKDAFNPSRRQEKDPAPASDVTEDNNEVPLRKPVLALHSQYFAKTWVA